MTPGRKRALAALFCAATLAACMDAAGGKAPDVTAAVSQPALLSASCSGCHAAKGDVIVSLTGLDAETLESRLLEYRNSDGTTPMHRLARTYSAEQITEIAVYLAKEAE